MVDGAAYARPPRTVPRQRCQGGGSGKGPGHAGEQCGCGQERSMLSCCHFLIIGNAC